MTPSRGLGFVDLLRTFLFLSLGFAVASAVYTPRKLDDTTVEEIKKILIQSQDTMNPTAVLEQLGLSNSLDSATLQGPSSAVNITSALILGLLGGAHNALGLRDVWAPEITTPDESTVWLKGSKATVTWNTRGAPEQLTDTKGRLLLGRLEDGDPYDEHLDVGHPLAYGFNMMDGRVKIRVPDVEPSNNYIVVLIGESGDRSPTFTIN